MQEQARKDRGAALIAWTLMLANRSEHGRAIEFDEVMAMLGHEPPPVVRPPPPTPEELAQQVRLMQAFYGNATPPGEG